MSIVVVAFVVPLWLWGEIPHTRLVVWGICLAAFAVATTQTSPPMAGGLAARGVRHLWNWASTIFWGALPWLSPTALDVDHVAWIMVFVVVYGVATDVVFLPRTLETRLFAFIVSYSASYVVALGVAEQWGAALAVFGAVLALCAGGDAWQHMATRLIEERDESAKRVLTDGLTGLGSREAASARVAEILRTAAPGEVIHCLFVDLDDFKQLNDTYGYEFGDAALQHIAIHLRARLPESWSIARFGGDEFVAVGLEPPDFRGMLEVTLPLPADRGGSEVVHRLSIGSTSLAVVQASAPTLFREAAAALRRAKTLGKHRVVVMTDELRSVDDARSRLGSRVGRALESGEIVPWGQPVVDLRTAVPVGIELLARWPQADGSIVMPIDFVPLVEDQGRGPQLGMMMVEFGIDLLAELARLENTMFVSVNLSARHLFHRRLPREISDLLDAQHVAPGRLVLEITESQHLPSSPVWEQTTRQLRSLGVGLAIDDFGTGYSSMEQLLSMPFTHLKVDRVFTRSMDLPGAHDLAAAIAAMARGAGMTPIAEGIETEHEQAAMLAAGYLHGQGFLFARPQPLDVVLAAVASAGPEVAPRADDTNAMGNQ